MINIVEIEKIPDLGTRLVFIEEEIYKLGRIAPTLTPLERLEAQQDIELLQARFESTLNLLNERTAKENLKSDLENKYKKLMEIETNYQSSLNEYRALIERGEPVPDYLQRVIDNYNSLRAPLLVDVPNPLAPFSELKEYFEEEMSNLSFDINKLNGRYHPDVAKADLIKLKELEKYIASKEKARIELNKFKQKYPGLAKVNDRKKKYEELERKLNDVRTSNRDKIDISKKLQELKTMIDYDDVIRNFSGKDKNPASELKKLMDRYGASNIKSLEEVLKKALSDIQIDPSNPREIHEANPAPASTDPTTATRSSTPATANPAPATRSSTPATASPASTTRIPSASTVNARTPSPDHASTSSPSLPETHVNARKPQKLDTLLLDNKQILESFVSTGNTNKDLAVINLKSINLGTTKSTFTYYRQIQDRDPSTGESMVKVVCVKEDIGPYLARPVEAYRQVLQDVLQDKYLYTQCRDTQTDPKMKRIYSKDSRFIKYAMKNFKNEIKSNNYRNAIERMVAVRSANTPYALEQAISSDIPPMPLSKDGTYNIEINVREKKLLPRLFNGIGKTRPDHILKPVPERVEEPSMFNRYPQEAYRAPKLVEPIHRRTGRDERGER